MGRTLSLNLVGTAVAALTVFPLTGLAGAQAANDLDAFIVRRPVNCVPISLDRYGRTVATRQVGNADIGEWLVRNGLALDRPPVFERQVWCGSAGR
jgi:hypothetical protein